MSWRPYKVLNTTGEHDGDTIKVHVKPGFDLCHTINIRLMGIKAKELNESGGLEAKQFVVDWVKEHKVHPMKAWTLLTKTETEIETLGRWVGDLEDVTTGEHLCTALLAWLETHPGSKGGKVKPRANSQKKQGI